jgi:hypothetical protein
VQKTAQRVILSEWCRKPALDIKKQPEWMAAALDIKQQLEWMAADHRMMLKLWDLVNKARPKPRVSQ